MTDNVGVTAGSGTTVRTRDLSEDGAGSSLQAQMTIVRGWPPIVLGKAYAVNVGTSVVYNGNGLTIPSNTTHLLITVESGDVRYSEDGTSPTATNGLLLPAGSMIELPVPISGTTLEPNNLRFIQSNTATVEPIIQISYRQYI